MVMPVDIREADADQWGARIALQVFAIGIADHEVRLVGKERANACATDPC